MMMSSNLQQAITTAGDGATIITATGTCNSSVSTILNAGLATSIPELSANDNDQRVNLLATGKRDISTLMLTLEGIDSSNNEFERDDALSFSISLSGIMLLSVNIHDIIRANACGIPRLMVAIEKSLQLKAAGVGPVLPTRKLIMVLINQYDQVDADGDVSEIQTYVEQLLIDQYTQLVDAPESLSANAFMDMFDVQISLLHSIKHHPEEYANDIINFKNQLTDNLANYTDAGATEQSILSHSESIKNCILSTSSSPSPFITTSSTSPSTPNSNNNNNNAKDLPSEMELNATYQCDLIMKSCLDKFRNKLKLWRASIDAGRVIQSFGNENDKLMKRILQMYDEESSIQFKESKACLRKREELNSLLLSDSYALFAKQILKIRESSYQIFRGKLARIRIDDHVEKKIKVAVRESEAHFIEHADSIKSKTASNWRFDNERFELVNHMRDDAMERLQLAKLQGNYVPNIRTPVAFAFHTLLLAPFGKDSRLAAQSPNDEMKPNFDPDKIKQPSMMRSRPYQRGHSFHYGKKEEFSQESLDLLSPLFEPSSSGGTSS